MVIDRTIHMLSLQALDCGKKDLNHVHESQEESSDDDSFADYNDEDLTYWKLAAFVNSTEDSTPHEEDDTETTLDFEFERNQDDGYDQVTENRAAENKSAKRVRFGGVQVREYALTVGDLTAIDEDSCPLQLDWNHAPKDLCYPDQCFFAMRYQRRNGVRRLSPDERRQRIAAVQGMSVQEVHKIEYDVVLDQINREQAYQRRQTQTYSDAEKQSVLGCVFDMNRPALSAITPAA
jgi:hypothetical protein